MKRKFRTTKSPMREILCMRPTVNRGRKYRISQLFLTVLHSWSDLKLRGWWTMGLDCLKVGGQAPKASSWMKVSLLGRRIVLTTWTHTWASLSPCGAGTTGDRGICYLTPQGCCWPNSQCKIFLNSNVGNSPRPTTHFSNKPREWKGDAAVPEETILEGT